MKRDLGVDLHIVKETYMYRSCLHLYMWGIMSKEISSYEKRPYKYEKRPTYNLQM